MKIKNVLIGLLTGLIFINIGIVIGKFAERTILLNQYCQSIEYDGMTKINGIEYCYNDNDLFVIEWVKE